MGGGGGGFGGGDTAGGTGGDAGSGGGADAAGGGFGSGDSGEASDSGESGDLADANTIDAQYLYDFLVSALDSGVAFLADVGSFVVSTVSGWWGGIVSALSSDDGPDGNAGNDRADPTPQGSGGDSDGGLLAPELIITATPAVVSAGSSSTVRWEAHNVRSCTVTGPGVAGATTHGSAPTGPIVSRSEYVLRCTTLSGGERRASAFVNLNPSFEEF